ncbi:glycosyltransferase, partial [Trifolium medium]|nr:glycosyltransferase [Trifolium medium]
VLEWRNLRMSCDRSGYRSDICVMKGDIRTHSSSSSIFLYNSISHNNNVSRTDEARKGEEEGEEVSVFIRNEEEIAPHSFHSHLPLIYPSGGGRRFVDGGCGSGRFEEPRLLIPCW